MTDANDLAHVPTGKLERRLASWLTVNPNYMGGCRDKIVAELRAELDRRAQVEARS